MLDQCLTHRRQPIGIGVGADGLCVGGNRRGLGDDTLGGVADAAPVRRVQAWFPWAPTFATAAGLASSVLKAATASGSIDPQERSNEATSRRTSRRKVEASAFLSSMEMMLARSVPQLASGEKLAR